LFDNEYKRTSPRKPETLYAVATMADLPDPSKFTDCIALARDTGPVWCDGSAWSVI